MPESTSATSTRPPRGSEPAPIVARTESMVVLTTAAPSSALRMAKRRSRFTERTPGLRRSSLRPRHGTCATKPVHELDMTLHTSTEPLDGGFGGGS